MMEGIVVVLMLMVLVEKSEFEVVIDFLRVVSNWFSYLSRGSILVVMIFGSSLMVMILV